jgi:glycosyltransferase involved in cell wall biosynthesis
MGKHVVGRHGGGHLILEAVLNEEAGSEVTAESVAAPTRDPRISVVIPALNEAENLRFVLPKIPDYVDEVLVVDGASTDGTPDVARTLRPDVRIVEQEGRGKGAALRTGFHYATCDIIVMMDADGSMDPAEIDRFVQAIRDGADMAKGSRFLKGGGTSDMPLYRKLGNWGFVLLVRALFGGTYTDLCYGYNAFKASALSQMNLECDGFEVETVMNVRALRAGLRVEEVPSFEAARVYGTGRLRTIPDGWRVLKALLSEGMAHHRGKGIGLTGETSTAVVQAGEAV